MEGHGPKRVHVEAILLDLGEGFGALVAYAQPQLAGREIELIRPDGVRRVHTEVHERVINGKTVFVGVFPDLPEGIYGLVTDQPTRSQVEIKSGVVTEIDWP